MAIESTLYHQISSVLLCPLTSFAIRLSLYKLIINSAFCFPFYFYNRYIWSPAVNEVQLELTLKSSDKLKYLTW